MSVQILFRRGTAADWTSANPTLGNGEPGFETDTGRLKIGDGATTWNLLAYVDGAGVADGNTTYTVSAETATGGVDIRLTGSDATTDAVKIAAGSNVTVTRTDASTITIASTAVGGATTIAGLDDVVVTTPSAGQVLKYDGTNWINDTDLNTGTGSLALGDLTNVTLTTPSNGQVLKFNGTAWVNDTDATGGGGGTLATRADLVGTTGSLANGASGPINLTGYSAYALLKIQTSAAAWVRLYVSEAARAADNARLQGVDPAPGSGVIAEVVTTGAETVLISPGTIGFNNEGPVTTNMPMRVTNLSGGTTDITVTLTAIQLEA